MSEPATPTRAQAAAQRRAATVESLRASGALACPAALPLAARRDDLMAAIRDHQVVIVAGETGSGKSTQLPKLCLDLGRGVAGLVGHTQPRRMAARTIAERVAEELGTELGATVGYTVRFTDTVGEQTLVKVMTDGILLAEIQRDRMLRRYDTLIIDEAHERSLNIDFLLGYLAQLLPKRPDLKLIVTSATIDTQRFSEHFAQPDGRPAPIIEVSGRTFPVEVRYRPFGARDDDPDDDRDQVQAIVDAVDELAHEGDGDVLVFLSGEREIHDTADALRRHFTESARTARGAAADVLPLYARLSAVEQHRIWQPHRGRRVVLSTNVAETSLTVPGVRYVVDAGAARMSRYSHRLKVQRLPIEAVSQASANQRAGRCGRVAPGICIRLYDEAGFGDRPEFTEPEILRTNLASVILQMTALGLGDVGAFPFLDPPDPRSVRDGYGLLEELGAIEPSATTGTHLDGRRRLTPLGKRLARLPIDPRLGRMVLEAERHGCVRELMIITSVLSIQDPRERPAEHRAAADELHRRFEVPGSDFLSLVKLWDHLRERQHALNSSQFRKLCRTEYLNYLRVREWQDLFSQLRHRHSPGQPLGRRQRRPPRPSAPGLALRLAQPPGHARRHDSRVQGCARLEVRDRARLGAVQGVAEVDHRRRAGGDQPVVGPRRRLRATRVGRGTGQAPLQVQLRRAVLGCPPRRGSVQRTGGTVRAAHRQQPTHASCSSAVRWWTANGARMMGPPTSSGATTSASSAISRAGASGCAAPTSWTRKPCSRTTTGGWARRW